jgi:hypothetical protein
MPEDTLAKNNILSQLNNILPKDISKIILSYNYFDNPSEAVAQGIPYICGYIKIYILYGYHDIVRERVKNNQKIKKDAYIIYATMGDPRCIEYIESNSSINYAVMSGNVDLVRYLWYHPDIDKLNVEYSVYANSIPIASIIRKDYISIMKYTNDTENIVDHLLLYRRYNTIKYLINHNGPITKIKKRLNDKLLDQTFMYDKVMIKKLLDEIR